MDDPIVNPAGYCQCDQEHTNTNNNKKIQMEITADFIMITGTFKSIIVNHVRILMRCWLDSVPQGAGGVISPLYTPSL